MDDTHKNDKKCSCHGHGCGKKDKKDTPHVDVDRATTNCENTSEGDTNVVSKDLYVRLLADFENFKKRTEKEKENTFLFVERMVLTDFLGVVDDFERLLNDKAIDKKTHEGVELIYKKMMTLLAKFNVVKIDLKEGDLFDDSVAESISSQHVDDEKKDNTIAKKYEDGYKIGNIVLRYAKVVVNKYSNK